MSKNTLIHLNGLDVTSYLVSAERVSTYGDAITTYALEFTKNVNDAVVISNALTVEVWIDSSVPPTTKVFDGFIDLFKPEKGMIEIIAKDQLAVLINRQVMHYYVSNVPGDASYPDGKLSNIFADLVVTHGGLSCISFGVTLTVQDSGTTTVQTSASVDGWDQTATMNPILDITNGAQLIRAKGYNPNGGILAMNSIEHKYLLNFLISVKGSSIPSFANDKLKSGVIMEILGWNVVVDELLTTDWVYQWVPDRAATWKSFMGITSVAIKEPLIGTTIRVAEEGECILHDPNAVHIISDTIG